MSIIARQSTARTVMVGPILDADGAAVTDSVVGDLKISKNGGAPGALNGSATLTHRATGHYSLALTASDLDTVGQAEVIIDDTTNAMPVKVITVIEEAVYDTIFAASAVGPLAANSNGSGLTALGDARIGNLDVLLSSRAPESGGNLATLLSRIVGTLASGTHQPQSGDSFARLGAPAGASVSADIAAIDANVDAVLADTGTDGVVVAAGSKTGYALTSGERDSIAAALLDLANGIETGITMRAALRAIAAICAGKASGAGTGTETFKGIDSETDRVEVTVDNDGNRTAITLDP